MASKATRLRVISLYKELHRLGREYPDPAYNFHGRLRGLFEKNKNLTDEAEIEKAIKLGEYIRNETIALYKLRKYRHLKRMYPEHSVMDPFTDLHPLDEKSKMLPQKSLHDLKPGSGRPRKVIRTPRVDCTMLLRVAAEHVPFARASRFDAYIGQAAWMSSSLGSERERMMSRTQGRIDACYYLYAQSVRHVCFSDGIGSIAYALPLIAAPSNSFLSSALSPTQTNIPIVTSKISEFLSPFSLSYTKHTRRFDQHTLEKEKQRNLKKEQHKTSTPIRNAPGWNEYLASASEAAIKADRSDFTPEEMASETLKHVKSRHENNNEERVDAYEASYERDETTGPLGDAAHKGTVEEVKVKERVSQKGKGTSPGSA
ncbi:hypothetical protein NM688_g2400 [Phlebia brevispora]|uniref:Uncharacterized protein n=1 Tax=Phlebia brevispora TaxID=194682 RepID=A0ACC1T8Z7_9APHY|nr:hypothetical protein NM688_g2400 [Phlebia brevispora]